MSLNLDLEIEASERRQILTSPVEPRHPSIPPEVYAHTAALMRCSDRALGDIGIGRQHIPLTVRGLNPRRAASQTLPAGHRRSALLACSSPWPCCSEG